MGESFRIGLGAERVAPFGQAVAKLAEVLDDSVVDDGDRPGAVDVGMGVEVVWSAVRRPSGVGKTDSGRRRHLGKGGLKVGQLARLLLDEELSVCGYEGDPGRVVASIFEPSKSFEEDRRRLARPRVADDAAHTVDLRPAVLPALPPDGPMTSGRT